MSGPPLCWENRILLESSQTKRSAFDGAIVGRPTLGAAAVTAPSSSSHITAAAALLQRQPAPTTACDPPATTSTQRARSTHNLLPAFPSAVDLGASRFASRRNPPTHSSQSPASSPKRAIKSARKRPAQNVLQQGIQSNPVQSDAVEPQSPPYPPPHPADTVTTRASSSLKRLGAQFVRLRPTNSCCWTNNSSPSHASLRVLAHTPRSTTCSASLPPPPPATRASPQPLSPHPPVA